MAHKKKKKTKESIGEMAGKTRYRRIEGRKKLYRHCQQL